MCAKRISRERRSSVNEEKKISRSLFLSFDNEAMNFRSPEDSLDDRLQRSNFYEFLFAPFLWFFNTARDFFTSRESTDGKKGVSRSSRSWTHRIRKFFSRSKKIETFPRLKLPEINLENEYKMSHKSRGLAVIFNHQYFDESTGYSTRLGTEVDLERLTRTCQQLEFEVESYNDLRREEIFRRLEKISSLDHSNSDCILIAILTHGTKGQIFSRDDAYDIEQVTSYFTDESCPTLSGKPKIFLIQACRGEKLDYGHQIFYSLEYRLQRQDLRGGMEKVDVSTFAEVPEELQDPDMVHNPPNHPDFLIVRSTMPKLVSFRNTTNGSWFIESLCDELNETGNFYDILTILTFVNRRVAERESSKDKAKQILSISTMLRKRLILHKKNF